MASQSFEREGILFCLIGPAGSGKTTIAEKLLRKFRSTLKQSVSYTTRPKRANEKEGKSYHFVDLETFKKLDKTGKLFEKERIHGQYYGTPHSNIKHATKGEHDLLLVIDIAGALNLKKKYPKNCIICCLLPPDFAELKKRMLARGKTSSEEIRRRLETARREISKLTRLRNNSSSIDYVVRNLDINQTFLKISSILVAERAAFKRIKDRKILK